LAADIHRQGLPSRSEGSVLLGTHISLREGGLGIGFPMLLLRKMPFLLLLIFDRTSYFNYYDFRYHERKNEKKSNLKARKSFWQIIPHYSQNDRNFSWSITVKLKVK
jgi:hypothetical protein